MYSETGFEKDAKLLRAGRSINVHWTFTPLVAEAIGEGGPLVAEAIGEGDGVRELTCCTRFQIPRFQIIPKLLHSPLYTPPPYFLVNLCAPSAFVAITVVSSLHRRGSTK